MIELMREATFLEQKLQILRLERKKMCPNNAVAAWEEKAIIQRHKLQQSEQMNEKLRRALFLQSGFVRNMRRMFSETMPSSIGVNMRSFLHTPTHLSKDQLSRVRNLERVCNNAKLDMTKQIIMDETSRVKPSKTPHIAVHQVDFGREGFGMTSIAVYALETENACKTFKVMCSAILNSATEWPSHTLVSSSSTKVDLPPTCLNIGYNMSSSIYECDSTGEQVSVECRDIFYYRMTESCGLLLWDYVDADDINPLQRETAAMRCSIGGALVQSEICTDGVERIVCRNVCTAMHLVDTSELTPTLERFSKSRQLCAKNRASLVYETIKTGVVTSAC
ncbi:hypothetical protein PHPALM_11775 [Phytophthora palmivora]|uniref:M96 mating-specific protein family n=1 Tax=Phytophthora palmivora TaxID=4796 RepID=A0A2P4Y1F5_9STRA|nr:hypothetical protein PHPALM_11775 [Phytophthora palmivora]